MKKQMCNDVRLLRIHKQYLRSISGDTQRTTLKEYAIDATFKPWTDIPGPSSLPIIGTTHHFLPGGQFEHITGTELVSKLYKMYGPIVRMDAMFAKDPMIYLFDAESVSQIHRGENQMAVRPVFESLEYYRKFVRMDRQPDKPTGLLSDHGEKWYKLRTVVNPVMLSTKVMKLYTKAVDEVAIEIIERLKSVRDEKNMIRDNLNTEMNAWALESVGVFAFGRRMNCFDPKLNKDSPGRQMITVVHDILKLNQELNFKPSLWRLYATPSYKKAMKCYELQENLARDFIDLAVKELETHCQPVDQKGILEKLLEIDRDVALILANDMLLAAVDTTSNLVLGILYLLAINPEKQEKLRNEINSNSEKKSYLRACIKEASRLLPVAGQNMRQLTRDYNILGYKIPKGLQVIFAHQVMSRMEQYFIKPNEFIPERWITEKDDPLYHRNAHPFAYNPFGFGARSCIGRRIAELEMETFVARAVEHFELQWIGPPPEIVMSFVNYVKGPYHFIFNDAK